METSNQRLRVRLAARQIGSGVVRVFVVAGLGGMSGALFYFQSEALVGTMPLWQYASLVYASLIGVSAAVIFLLLPAFSQFVELTAASRFLLALVSIIDQEAAVRLTTSPLLNASLVVGGALILRHLVGMRIRPNDSIWTILRGSGRLRVG